MSNEKYVQRDLCDERFKRIMDKLDSIDGKLSNDLVHLEARVIKLENNKNQSGRDIKRTTLSVLSGGIVAFLAWVLGRYG